MEGEGMLERLNRRERMRLMKFVCSFAWADLEIRPEERQFVRKLINRLDLGPEEREQVQGWLDRPPEIESVDPTLVPHEHRRIFIDEIEGVIESDGEIAREERESFRLFEALVD
jgi:uncharacterized tellurite resistance protein B-like protein